MSKRLSVKFQIKILAVGDPHFDAKNAVQTDAMSREVCDIVARDREIDAVVVLGDILHRFGNDSVHVLSRAVSFLRGIRKELARHDEADRVSATGPPGPIEGRQLWVLIGNHERPNRQVFLTDEHQLTALSEWPNTVVADRVVPATLRGREFVLVPYVEPGRFAEALATHPSGPDAWQNAFAVFAHQEFFGAKLGGAGPSTPGDRYPLTAPLCISGHIHEYSQPQSNIIYPGTPFNEGWCLETLIGKFGGNQALSQFTFGRGGALLSHNRINLANIPRNATFVFSTPKEFHDAVEGFRSNSEQSLNGLVEFLKIPGPIASLRIKVRSTSKDEFTALVASSRSIRDLATFGVAVSYSAGDGKDATPLLHLRAAPALTRPQLPPATTRGATSGRPFSILLAEEIVAKQTAPETSSFLVRALPESRIREWITAKTSRKYDSLGSHAANLQ